MTKDHPRDPPHRKRVRHYDEPGQLHDLTFSCYERRPLLAENPIRELFCEAIDRALETQDFRLFAFVVMPEHVHLLVQPRNKSARISDFLFAIKRPSSYRIKQYLERTHPSFVASLMVRQRPGVQTFRFWQEGPGYDRNLTEPQTILTVIDYIQLNPVRRGLCERASEWKWSSARFFQADSAKRDPDLPRLTPLPPELLI